MTEVWKPVLDYEDLYEVSNIGSVRRITNRFGNPSGRPCKPSVSRGYLRYTLSQSSETRTFAAHRMVWEAFNGRIPSGMQINHLNGVKNDNRIDNMEVCTPSENTLHKFRVLGHVGIKNPSPGERNGRAILKDADINPIRERLRRGETNEEIAASYGVSDATIWQIRKGNTWRHVG